MKKLIDYFTLKNIKLFPKLTMAILIPILIISLCLFIFIHNISRDILIDSNLNVMSAVSSQGSHLVEESLNTYLELVQAISMDSMITASETPWEEKTRIAAKYLECKNFIRISLVDHKGNTFSTDGFNTNIFNEPPFLMAMKGENYIYGPYVNDEGKYVISYSSPIISSGSIIGLCQIIMDGNNFSHIAESIKFLNTGSAYIINESGTVIASRNQTDVRNKVNTIENAKRNGSLEKLAEIENKMMQGHSNVDTFEQNGQKKFIAYAPINNGNVSWSIGVTIDFDEFMDMINPLDFSLILIISIAIVASMFLSFIIAKSISSRLVKLKNNIKEFSSGNFVYEEDLKHSKYNDEIGEISKALQISKYSLNNMLLNIKDLSNILNKESLNLFTASENITESSEHISSSMNQISSVSYNQSLELSGINSVAQGFNGKIINMNNSIYNINKITDTLRNSSKNNISTMSELTDSIGAFNSRFDVFIDNLSIVSSKITSMENILNVMNSISTKTNLLSLNASIESAKAGKEGLGFSVITEEIRKLSNLSKESTLEIATLNKEILEYSISISKDSELIKSELYDQNLKINNYIASFKAIYELINNIGASIDTIAKNSNIINEENGYILNEISLISSKSQEISATTESIANSTNTFNDLSLDLKDSYLNLETLIKNLTSQIESFTLDLSEVTS